MAAAVPVEEADILQTFWGLSSLDDKKKIDSSRDLLTALLKKQGACAEGEISADVQYTVQRLVRGLASGRKGARHGFFLALTELLALFPVVRVSEVVKSMNTHLQPHAGIKGAEEKGIYFGRFFALLALSLSERLTDKEEILEVARELGAIAAKKPFMCEVCTVAMANMVECICHHHDVEGVRLGIVREGGVCDGWEGCTPERLYMYLRMCKVLSGVVWWEKLVKEKWKGGAENVISAGRLNDIVSILETSSSSHPRLHSVWQYVLQTVRDTPLFPEFWERVVEGSLMVSTLKKRLMAIKVLESILPNISSDEVAVVFSGNLLRCVLYNATSPSNYLYTPTRQLLGALSSCNDLPLEVRVSLFTHLQYRTSGCFDILTKSEAMKCLLSSLDVAGNERLISGLEEVFHSPINLTKYFDSDDPLSEPRTVQMWVADQLLAIIKNRSCKKSSQSNLSVAKFYLLHACYHNSTTSLPCCSHAPPIDRDTRRVLSVRLSSVLAELCTLVPASERAVKSEEGGWREGGRRMVGRVEETGELYLVTLLLYAQQLPSQPLENEALAAWEYVRSVLCELGGGDSGLQIEERAFQLLFAAVGLHLLIEPSTVSESMEDLKQCYSDMKQQLLQETTQQSRTPRRKSSRNSSSPLTSITDGNDESSPNWVEVLVDLLLSLLSRSSLLWRSVVEQVFRQLVNRVTPGVVQLITNVLQPQTKDELMEDDESEGEEGEMDEEGEKGEGEGEEGEMGEGEGEKGEDGGGSDGDGEGESGSDDSEGGDMEEDEIDAQFRDDIMKALGSAAAQSEDESDVSMSDGEMERVDEALAAVFHSKRSQQSNKKDEAKTIVHFKLRVLDLVQIILQRQHSNPVILDFILPMYHMIRSSRNNPDHTPLVSRAMQIFRTKLCITKKLPKQALDESHAHSILRELVQCLYKDNDQQSVVILNDGITFMIKLLLSCKTSCPSISPLTTRAGRKRKREAKQQEIQTTFGLLDVAMVTEWLSDALHNFITKKNSNVHHHLFSSYAERHPVLAWQLIGRMVEDLPSAASRFRKVQGLELLSQLLAAKIDDKVFVEVAMPHVAAIVSLCTEELSDCCHRPDKQAKPVLKLVLKLATSLKEQHQWKQSFQQSLIDALHSLCEGERCGEVTRRECDRVMSVLEEEGEVGEGEREEGEAGRKRRKGSRKTRTKSQV